VFQLDFDPQMLSYEELVRLVCANRRGGRAYSRQYMEVVLCADAAQEAAARRAGISVPIVRDARFYLAEDYHQKYYLRHDRTLMAELAGYMPRELVESRIAARLNGYVAGRGTSEQLREELQRLGLSAAGGAHLAKIVADRRGHL